MRTTINTSSISELQGHSLFPLCDVCGNWVSLCGSPGIRISYNGKGFLLTLFYEKDTSFTMPLTRSSDSVFFFFYGLMRIKYNCERDLLWLTNEGVYKRECD